MSTLSAQAHDHAQPSIFSKYPIATGVAVGVVSLVPHVFLTPNASLGFAAVLIGLIAGIYFGFAAVLIGLIAGIYFGFAVMNGSLRFRSGTCRGVWSST